MNHFYSELSRQSLMTPPRIRRSCIASFCAAACRIAAIIALTSTMQSCAYVPTRPTLSWFRRVPAALQARRVSLTPMGDVGTQFDNSIQLFGSRAVGRKNDNCKILYSLVYEVTILMLLRCIVIFAWNMTSATSIPCRGDICLDPTLKSVP